MPESSQCLHNFILLIFVCNQTPLNYLTCSKRLLHWGNADWFSIYSFTPTQLTRTTTTLWIFPTLVISHHLGCWTWFPAKDANKIRSLMFAIPSGEVAHPCSTLNICWPRETTLSCRKKKYTRQDNKSCNFLRINFIGYNHVYTCIYYVDLSRKKSTLTQRRGPLPNLLEIPVKLHTCMYGIPLPPHFHKIPIPFVGVVGIISVSAQFYLTCTCMRLGNGMRIEE